MFRRLLVLALALLVVSLLHKASPVSAQFPCSSSGPAVTVTFVNNSGGPVDILWINFTCGETLYRNALPNGQTHVQGTYVTHPWVVRNDATGALLYCFVTTQPATITITSTPVDNCTPPAAPPVPPAPIVVSAPVVPVPTIFIDGRINNHLWSDGGAPIAVYCNTVEGLNVYGIDSASHGYLLVHVDYEVITEVGVPQDGNHIFAEEDNLIVSRLNSGEFQVNAFYSDGKPYTLIWSGCPVVGSYTVQN